jgi:fatty acid desaturase
MFPMVPYHALPALHAEMKADTPKPYNSLIEAYREIIPAILRQVKDPAYHVKRELPPGAKPFPTSISAAQATH